MISKISEIHIVIFKTVRKSFAYNEGSLLAIAAPLGYGFDKFLNLVFEGIANKTLVMPVLLFAICLFTYGIVSMYDFFTGISASKKEHIISTGSPRGYIKSDKLWSSIWKFQAVIMVASLLVVFNYVFLLINFPTIAGFFQIGIPIFFMVVILFDIHSIGENHFRRYGSKPKFYTFMDEINEAVRTGIIEKIKKLF